jgi:hypothetical protein
VLGAGGRGGGALSRDDLGDLGDRRVRDRAARVDLAADARERALLVHRCEPPARSFGDQQPRRVRPDVDAGAAH